LFGFTEGLRCDLGLFARRSVAWVRDGIRIDLPEVQHDQETQLREWCRRKRRLRLADSTLTLVKLLEAGAVRLADLLQRMSDTFVPQTENAPCMIADALDDRYKEATRREDR
jgi:hypothetical protein